MGTGLSFISNFNPVAREHHALDDYKKLAQPKRAVVIALTILTAFLSLPIGGLGAVALFRHLTNYFLQQDEKILKLFNEVLKTIPETLPIEPVAKPKPVVKKKKVKKKKPHKEVVVLPAPEPPVLEIPKKPLDIQPTKKKGWVVSLLGKRTLTYSCLLVGAVAGGCLGFYATNLVTNFALFVATSRSTQEKVLSHGAEALAPYIDKCTACDVTLPPIPPGSPNASFLAEIDAELANLHAGNERRFTLLKKVGTQLAQAALATRNQTVSLTTAVAFAKVAFHVPITIANRMNWLGFAAGAVGGGVLGAYLANWLED